MQVDNQQAYLIHSRKYTDSRILVELLTRDYGRVSGVLRQSSKSLRQTKVQPFTSLLVSWKGTGSLKTLLHTEALALSQHLVAGNLFCGFYLNELILRCLQPDDSCELIFELYASTISQLEHVTSQPALELLLREFEFRLLGELGYGINFETDIHEATISAKEQGFYRFVIGEGFMPVFDGDVSLQWDFSAASLVAMRENKYDVEVLRAAKRLSRQALRPLLGDKPLKSRELFIK